MGCEADWSGVLTDQDGAVQGVPGSAAPWLGFASKPLEQPVAVRGSKEGEQ